MKVYIVYSFLTNHIYGVYESKRKAMLVIEYLNDNSFSRGHYRVIRKVVEWYGRVSRIIRINYWCRKFTRNNRVSSGNKSRVRRKTKEKKRGVFQWKLEPRTPRKWVHLSRQVEKEWPLFNIKNI